MLAGPKHLYRSYTTEELDRLMTARQPATATIRAREMNLYRRHRIYRPEKEALGVLAIEIQLT